MSRWSAAECILFGSAMVGASLSSSSPRYCPPRPSVSRCRIAIHMALVVMGSAFCVRPGSLGLPSCRHRPTPDPIRGRSAAHWPERSWQKAQRSHHSPLRPVERSVRHTYEHNLAPPEAARSPDAATTWWPRWGVRRLRPAPRRSAPTARKGLVISFCSASRRSTAKSKRASEEREAGGAVAHGRSKPRENGMSRFAHFTDAWGPPRGSHTCDAFAAVSHLVLEGAILPSSIGGSLVKLSVVPEEASKMPHHLCCFVCLRHLQMGAVG